MNFFQQATGQSFSSQYGAIFVKGLGGVDPFTINMVNNAVNVVGVMICLVLSDRAGRRLVMCATISLLSHVDRTTGQ